MRRKLTRLWGLASIVLLVVSASSRCGYANGPETVELNSLAQYYEPVVFDHAMHVDMLGENSCAVCHHHTVGTQLVDKTCMKCHEYGGETDSANCEDCHPANRFSAEYLAKIEKNIHLFHEDKPGLKGAFHQRCLGCHKEMDAGIGCEDCHARTEAGEKLFHAGKYAPEPKKHEAKH